MCSTLLQQRPVGVTLFALLISGCVAVAGRARSPLSKWFIVGIIGFTAIMVAFNGPLRNSTLALRDTNITWESAAIVASISVGYTLFVMFITARRGTRCGCTPR